MKGLSSQKGIPGQWEPRRMGGQSSVSYRRRQGFSHRVLRLVTREPTSVTKFQRNWGSRRVREATEGGVCVATRGLESIGESKQRLRSCLCWPPGHSLLVELCTCHMSHREVRSITIHGWSETTRARNRKSHLTMLKKVCLVNGILRKNSDTLLRA